MKTISFLCFIYHFLIIRFYLLSQDVFGKKTYIATQGKLTRYEKKSHFLLSRIYDKYLSITFILIGPKNSTIADFWRMVWQENARIIVCLTNINEAKTVR